MTYATVTLHANDSVNLTTGVVTRSGTNTTAPTQTLTTTERILRDSRSRVSRKNDVRALFYVITHTSS